MAKFKLNKKVIGYVLTIVILGLFFYYLLTHLEDFKALLEVNPLLLLVIAALYIILFWIRGFFYKYILEPYNINLSSFDGFYSSYITAFGNYFLPLQGGAGLRAVYLKRKYNLKYTDFISTLSGTFILTFIIISAIGLLSVFAIYGTDFMSGLVLYVFFAFFLFGCVISSLLRFSKLTGFFKEKVKIPIISGLLNTAHEILVSWEYLLTHKKILLKLAWIIIIDLIFYSALIFVEFYALGVHIGAAQILLYISLGAFSVLVNLTPGSMGIKEAIFIASSAALSIGTPEILNLAVLDRGLYFIILLVVFLFTRFVLKISLNWKAKKAKKQEAVSAEPVPNL